MHLSFKSVCNKEHKGVICNMNSSSNSSQSTRPTGVRVYVIKTTRELYESSSSQSTRPAGRVGRVLGKNYSSFLNFTSNNQRTSGIFIPCNMYHIILVLINHATIMRKVTLNPSNGPLVVLNIFMYYSLSPFLSC